MYQHLGKVYIPKHGIWREGKRWEIWVVVCYGLLRGCSSLQTVFIYIISTAHDHRNAMQASSQFAKSHRLMLCDWKWPCHTLSIFLETSWNHSALGMFLQTKPSHINLSPLQHPALQLWRLRQQPDSCENEPVVNLGGYKRSVSRSWDENRWKISKEYQQILKVCLRRFLVGKNMHKN